MLSVRLCVFQQDFMRWHWGHLKTSWYEIGGSFDVPCSSSLCVFFDSHGMGFEIWKNERTLCMAVQWILWSPVLEQWPLQKYCKCCVFKLLTGTDGLQRAVALICSGGQWEQWMGFGIFWSTGCWRMSATIGPHRETMHAGAALSVYTAAGTGCLSPRVTRCCPALAWCDDVCAMDSISP